MVVCPAPTAGGLQLLRSCVKDVRPSGRPGSIRLSGNGTPRGREQQMKEFSSRGERFELGAVEYIFPPLDQSEAPVPKRSSPGEPPIVESKPIKRSKRPEARWPGATLPTRAREAPKETVPPLSPGFLARVRSPREGRRTGETAADELESAREKFDDAFGDWLATVCGDPFFFAATEDWHTESNPLAEAMDGIEGVSGWLQGVLDMPLKGLLSTTLGLSTGEAAVTAGVSTNLILAPITGPLDKAESYIGIGGVAFGLVTGGHGFILACVKPLLHQQLHHALVHAVVEVLGGSRTDRPQPDRPSAVGHNLRPPSDASDTAPHQQGIQPMPLQSEQHHARRPAWPSAPKAAPETRHQPTPREPLWLCLVFTSKPSPGSGAARTSTSRTAAWRNATRPVVLPLGL